MLTYNQSNGNHESSHGCIILPRADRLIIAESGDRELTVEGDTGTVGSP